MLACGNKCCAYCKESNNNCKNLCYQADICEDMENGNCNIRNNNTNVAMQHKNNNKVSYREKVAKENK